MSAVEAGRLPDFDQVMRWHEALVADDDHLQRLLKVKGWTPDALRKLQIGFDGNRVTIPYMDFEKVGNVMRYLPDRPVTDTSPKILPISSGHGKRLYPDPELFSKGSMVFLVEGEPDAITATSAGLNAIAVPGANSWRKSYADLLIGLQIVLCFDDDKPGKRLTENVNKDLVAAGVEVRIMDLSSENFDSVKGFDLGDYVVRAIQEAEPEEDLEALVKVVVKQLTTWAESLKPAVEIGIEDSDPLPPKPTRTLAAMLADVEAVIARYVVMPSDEARAAVTLWVIHTWAFEAAHATPYLLIISAEKRSGKTRLLETLEALVASPWRVISPSEAVLFRKIAKDCPTLLLDEVDALFASSSERTEPLRGVINAGNREGGSVPRCVGENSEVHDFGVFCPKVLAGIDEGEKLPDTIRDRSITIPMARKMTTEPVERMISRKVKAELEPLRNELEGWAAHNAVDLADAEPHLPAELDDRAAEGWEALFAIADAAGGRWNSRARDAARSLSSAGEDEGQTHGALILGEMRKLIGSDRAIGTKEILEHVNSSDDLPFGGWRHGEGIDGRILARILKPYAVKAKKVHIGHDEKRRGYHADDLEEAFDRWLPTPTPAEAEPAELAEPGPDVEPIAPHGRAKVPLVPQVPHIHTPDPGSGNHGPAVVEPEAREAA